MLSVDCKYCNMIKLYRYLYNSPSGYPKLNELGSFHITEDQYLVEPLSRLDNLVFVYQFLSKLEQVQEIRSLLNYGHLLTYTRIRKVTNLVLMIRTQFTIEKVEVEEKTEMVNNIGNSGNESSSSTGYKPEDIANVFASFAIEILSSLLQISDPTQQLSDPRAGIISWKLVNRLASHSCNLIVECVQHSRPPLYSRMSHMRDSQLWPVYNILKTCLDQLFYQRGIPALKAIYSQLCHRKLLFDSHLAYFLTKDHIIKYRKWLKMNKNTTSRTS